MRFNRHEPDHIIIAVLLTVLAGVLVYVGFSLLGEVSGARDDITQSRYSIEGHDRKVETHDAVLEGMGAELKGLSSDLEAIETACHEVARALPPKKRDVRTKYERYTICMAKHGWKPVGWRG